MDSRDAVEEAEEFGGGEVKSQNLQKRGQSVLKRTDDSHETKHTTSDQLTFTGEIKI